MHHGAYTASGEHHPGGAPHVAHQQAAPQAGFGAAETRRAIQISLTEHGIGMVIPPGAQFRSAAGAAIESPMGILVLGTVQADIVCHGGSIVIGQGGVVIGCVKADRIYIEGELLSGSGPGATRSVAAARMLIMATPTANIDADLVSPFLSLQTSRIKGSLSTTGADAHDRS